MAKHNAVHGRTDAHLICDLDDVISDEQMEALEEVAGDHYDRYHDDHTIAPPINAVVAKTAQKALRERSTFEGSVRSQQHNERVLICRPNTTQTVRAGDYTWELRKVMQSPDVLSRDEWTGVAAKKLAMFAVRVIQQVVGEE